jgi:hypothetical protein
LGSSPYWRALWILERRHLGKRAVGVAGGWLAPSLAPIEKPYKPKFDQANFVGTIDNKYWPLKPGTTFHYKGVKGTQHQIDNEAVTH